MSMSPCGPYRWLASTSSDHWTKTCSIQLCVCNTQCLLRLDEFVRGLHGTETAVSRRVRGRNGIHTEAEERSSERQRCHVQDSGCTDWHSGWGLRNLGILCHPAQSLGLQVKEAQSIPEGGVNLAGASWTEEVGFVFAKKTKTRHLFYALCRLQSSVCATSTRYNAAHRWARHWYKRYLSHASHWHTVKITTLRWEIKTKTLGFVN